MIEYEKLNPLEQELASRLEVIDKYFPLDTLLEKKLDNEAVAKYYRKSDFFYNKVLNRGGHSIHVGLSDDGLYRKADFRKQAQFVGSLLDRPDMQVLEVGAGQLYNTRYLAKQYPGQHFTALDIPGRRFLKNRVPSNLRLVEGDYHDLSLFPENSFDIVFGVETICYSKNKNRVVAEISRVLKPGGKLVIFDTFKPRPRSEMTPFQERCAAITGAAMCVDTSDFFLDDMRNYLKNNGFADIQIADLTRQAKPTLRRLDRIACYYFMHPRLLKWSRKILSDEVLMNGIAGWTMLLVCEGRDIIQYNRIVATKG